MRSMLCSPLSPSLLGFLIQKTVVSRLGLDLRVERGRLCKVPGSILSTRYGGRGAGNAKKCYVSSLVTSVRILIAGSDQESIGVSASWVV